MNDNYIKSINALTSIPTYIVSRVCKYNVLLASQDVAENKQQGVRDFIIETAGYGNIVAHLEEDELKLRLDPSPEFTSAVVKAATTGQSELINKLEDKLIKTLDNQFNDVFEGNRLSIERKDSMTSIGKTLLAYLSNTKHITRAQLTDKIKDLFSLYGCDIGGTK